MDKLKLSFGSVATSLLIVGLCNPWASAQSVEGWVEQAMGSYQSQIWSLGSLLSGSTEFTVTSDSSIEGTYTMEEPDGVVLGDLSQCQAVRFLVLNCIWNDKYGTGSLEVIFSSDFSGFRGYWGIGNADPEFEWNGSRKM